MRKVGLKSCRVKRRTKRGIKVVRPALSDLKMHPPHRVFRKSRDGVVGLDTEGLNTGYAFLITDSPMGNHRWIRSAQDVVAFLANPAYATSFNTFWNIDYDVTVLMKWFGREFCTALASKEHTAEYEGVAFTYIPRRFLSVRAGKLRNIFYDAAQYFIPRSLDGASKTYLGEGKIDIGSKEFGPSDYDREDLLKYCKDDSRKCCLLTRKLLCDLHDMGFSPNTLASPGTIMEEALVGKVHIPDITKIPQGALEYAYEAYKGGWMECFKKGHFKTLYDYDISSAYPYQVSELISLDDGKWFHRKGVVNPSEFTYGWVNGKVHITSPTLPSPILFRGDVNYTGYGSWHTKVFEEEARFIAPNGLGSFDVKDGWYFLASPRAIKPFRFEMRRLFRQKQQVQNAWLPKSMSVALYGKYAQKDEDGNTGNLFNPIYASIITARTRLKMAGYALLLPEALCLVSTDGLDFDRPLPTSCLGKDLGDLQLKYSGEGVIIGTNVYTIKGKDPGGEWRPGRYDWLHLLAKNPDQGTYNLKYFRYTTLAEGVESNFDKVGIFNDFPYTFNVNYDHKRCFQHFSTGGDLLSHQYESIAWPIDVVQNRKGLWSLMPY